MSSADTIDVIAQQIYEELLPVAAFLRAGPGDTKTRGAAGTHVEHS
jgi:hypothetical protein